MAAPPPPFAGPQHGAAPSAGEHPGAAPAEGASAIHAPPHPIGIVPPVPSAGHPGAPAAPLPRGYPDAPPVALLPGPPRAPPAAPPGHQGAPSHLDPEPPGYQEALSPAAPTPPGEPSPLPAAPQPPAAAPPPPAFAQPPAVISSPPAPQVPVAIEQYTEKTAWQMPGTCEVAVPPLPHAGMHPGAAPNEGATASHTLPYAAGAAPPASPSGHPGAPPAPLPPRHPSIPAVPSPAGHPGAPRMAEIGPELRKLLDMESQIEQISEQIEQITSFITGPDSTGGYGGAATGFGGPPSMMTAFGFDMPMPGAYGGFAMPPSIPPMPGMASAFNAERFSEAYGRPDMEPRMSGSAGWPRAGPREYGRPTVSRENARPPREDNFEYDQDNEQRRFPSMPSNLGHQPLRQSQPQEEAFGSNIWAAFFRK